MQQCHYLKLYIIFTHLALRQLHNPEKIKLVLATVKHAYYKNVVQGWAESVKGGGGGDRVILLSVFFHKGKAVIYLQPI